MKTKKLYKLKKKYKYFKTQKGSGKSICDALKSNTQIPKKSNKIIITIPADRPDSTPPKLKMPANTLIQIINNFKTMILSHYGSTEVNYTIITTEIGEGKKLYDKLIGFRNIICSIKNPENAKELLYTLIKNYKPGDPIPKDIQKIINDKTQIKPYISDKIPGGFFTLIKYIPDIPKQLYKYEVLGIDKKKSEYLQKLCLRINDLLEKNFKHLPAGTVDYRDIMTKKYVNNNIIKLGKEVDIVIKKFISDEHYENIEYIFE